MRRSISVFVRFLSASVLAFATAESVGSDAGPVAPQVESSRSIVADIDARVIAAGGQALLVDRAELESIAVGQRLVLEQFPLSLTESVDLDLRRLESPAVDAAHWVVDEVGHATQRDTEPVALFAGEIVGEPDSRVFLSVSAHGVYGWVQSEGRRYIVTTGSPLDPHAPAVFDMDSEAFRAIDWKPFGCEVLPAEDDGSAGPDGPESSGLMPLCQRVELAIDTDTQYRDMFPSSGAALAYIQTLVAAGSQIYRSESSIELQIVFTRLWEGGTDPWSGTSTSSRLGEFRDHWNNNMASQSRDLAHLLSGASLGGGIAYLSAVCSSSFGYAVSANLDGFFPTPLQSNNPQNWDIMVFAHELGHNFGSEHTHELVPPYDSCGDGDCSNAAAIGTIMSYCHICSGGLANIRLQFAPPNRSQIASHMGSRPCLSSGDCEGTSCVRGIGPGARVVPTGGGAFAIAVAGESSSCAWSIADLDSSESQWVTITTSQPSGLAGTAFCRVSANTTGATRTAAFRIGDREFTLRQPGDSSCVLNLPSAAVSAPSSSGSSIVSFEASSSSCAWTTASGASWLTVSPASGIGPGTVTMSFTSNPTGSPRSANVTIGGNTLVLTQASGAGCAVSLSASGASLPASNSAGSVVVSAGASCGWSTASSVSWLAVGPPSGTGNATVRFAATANTSTTGRSGVIRIGGRTLTVTQAAGSGCGFSLSESSGSVGSAAGSRTVGVSSSVSSNCLWSASTSASWITVTPTSGMGNGSVALTYSQNTSTSSRSANVTIAGVTYSLTQTGAQNCTFTSSASAFSATAGTWSGTFTLSASASSCAWTASSDSSWLTVSPFGGTGTASLTINASSNPSSSARTGTITAGGRTVTVTQAGAVACTYTVSSSSLTAGSAAWGANVALTASAVSCPWSATSDSSWLSVSPSAGNGSATLALSASANPTTSARTGVISVAGRTITVTQSAGTGSGSTVNIAGWKTYGDQFSTANSSVLVTVPAGVTSLNSLNYSVSFSAVGNSYRREFIIRVEVPGDPSRYLAVRPSSEGSPGAFSGSGSSSTNLFGGAPFLIPAGTTALRLFVYETYDDAGAGLDASVTSGSVTLGFVSSPACTYSLSASAVSATAAAWSGSVSLTASGSACPWTASSSASWLSVSPASGSGSAQVALACTANTASSARTATATIAGRTVTVTQAGSSSASTNIAGWATYGLMSSSGNSSVLVPVPAGATTLSSLGYTINFDALGQSWRSDLVIRVEVPADPSRSLSVRPSASNSPGNFSGTGNSSTNLYGGAPFSIPAGTTSLRVFVFETYDDAGQDARVNSGSVTLGFGGGSSCSYALSSSSASAPSSAWSGSVALSASASSCTWSAASDSSWLSASPASGSGSATLTVSCASNPGATARSGSITVGGQVFTVTQAGAPACTYSLSSSSLSATAAAWQGSVVLTASAASCPWTASTPSTWVTLSPSTGTGSQTVLISCSANTSTTSRTATITIAGRTLTLTQAGAPACTYALSAGSMSATAAAWTGFVTLSASSATCGWTASSSASWLSVSPSSGSGSATLVLTCSQNTSSSSRTGVVSVAGQTVSVTQAGASACTFSLPSSGASVGSSSWSTGLFLSASGSGCSWSATSGASWLSVSPTSGTGSASVTVSCPANTGSAARVGTVTIAGRTFTVTQAGGTSSGSTVTIAGWSTFGAINSTLNSSVTVPVPAGATNLSSLSYSVNFDAFSPSWRSDLIIRVEVPGFTTRYLSVRPAPSTSSPGNHSGSGSSTTVTFGGAPFAIPAGTTSLRLFVYELWDDSGQDARVNSGTVSLGFSSGLPLADPGCPADLDLDGTVTSADLGALLGALGTSGSGLAGDLDADGAVTGEDLGLLLGAWGTCGE